MDDDHSGGSGVTRLGEYSFPKTSTSPRARATVDTGRKAGPGRALWGESAAESPRDQVQLLTPEFPSVVPLKMDQPWPFLRWVGDIADGSVDGTSNSGSSRPAAADVVVPVPLE